MLFLTLALTLAQPATGTYQLRGVPGEWGRLYPRGPVWIADRSPFRYMLTGPAHNGPGVWKFGAGSATGSRVYEVAGWNGAGSAVLKIVNPPPGKADAVIVLDAVP